MKIDEMNDALRTETWDRPRIIEEDGRLFTAGKHALMFPGARAVPGQMTSGKTTRPHYVAYWCWILAGRTAVAAFEFNIDPKNLKASRAEYDRASHYAREALIDHVRELLKPESIEDGAALPAPKEPADA